MSSRGRKLLCSPAPKQTHILGTSWHETRNEKENTSPGRVCTHWRSPTEVDYFHIVLSRRLRHKRMRWIECIVFFFLHLKKKKFFFQKLSQTRRNHKPNPAVLGFIHLCSFKNKMSVQLQELQGLNISKHRKVWVVFSSNVKSPQWQVLVSWYSSTLPNCSAFEVHSPTKIFKLPRGIAFRVLWRVWKDCHPLIFTMLTVIFFKVIYNPLIQVSILWNKHRIHSSLLEVQHAHS